ncbi:hypothetical protein Mapa_007494 [Marchantia paleacea]|nr:hypothetical protein Mapa_007494 [Marchantia paleacea]
MQVCEGAQVPGLLGFRRQKFCSHGPLQEDKTSIPVWMFIDYGSKTCRDCVWCIVTIFMIQT